MNKTIDWLLKKGIPSYVQRFVRGSPYPDWALADRDLWLPMMMDE